MDRLATSADRWLAHLEGALSSGDEGAIAALFDADGHWRDVLALTWRIGTLSGAGTVARGLKQHAARARPRSFRVDPDRTPPREVTRAVMWL